VACSLHFTPGVQSACAFYPQSVACSLHFTPGLLSACAFYPRSVDCMCTLPPVCGLQSAFYPRSAICMCILPPLCSLQSAFYTVQNIIALLVGLNQHRLLVVRLYIQVLLDFNLNKQVVSICNPQLSKYTCQVLA